MSYLEGVYEQVSHRLDSMDANILALGAKIDAFYTRLDEKIDKRFMWTIGIVVSTILASVLPLYFRH